MTVINEENAAEFTELREAIFKAAIRADAVKKLRIAAKRERDGLKAARVGTGNKPSSLEAATSKGLWGLDEYQKVAEKEFENLLTFWTEKVAQLAIDYYVESQKPAPVEKPRRTRRTSPPTPTEIVATIKQEPVKETARPKVAKRNYNKKK